MSVFPPLPVVIPLAVAALLAALNRHVSRRTGFVVAIAAASATLYCTIVLLVESVPNPIVYWFGNWQPRHGVALGISFVIDPLGAGLASLAAVLTLAALIFSTRYFAAIGTLFHTLMLVFLAAMCGFSLTGDLFNLFVFFELMSAAAYGLCGYKTEEPGPIQGALNFAITNSVGCYIILTGLGLIYARTGALNMAQIGRALDGGPCDALVIAAFTFIACGFLIKAAVVPFHFWLADAHAVAPTPVCVLFSGIMVELGLYGVARCYWTMFSGVFGPHADALRALFAGVGVATALVGGGMCFGQRNLKRLLAFSTISHMGLMVIGFSLLSVTGVAGMACYILGHAGAKAGLFLCAGIILHREQTVDEMDLWHRTFRLPFVMGALVFGAIALAGAPLSGTSLGDTFMHAAGSAEGFGWITWIAMASGILTAGAVLRFAARTYAGLGPAAAEEPEEPQKTPEKPETTTGHQHTPAVMFIPAILLIATGLLAGAVPGVGAFMMGAAARFTDHAAYIHRVLNGAPQAAPALPAIPAHDPAHGAITLAAAIALALGYLRWERGRHTLHGVGKAVRVIRNLHSGHVGDYVTWVIFGVAAFGVASLVLLR